MTTKIITRRTRSSADAKVSDGFVYRGVRINRFLKPTKRTRVIDAAMRRVMKVTFAEPVSR